MIKIIYFGSIKIKILSFTFQFNNLIPDSTFVCELLSTQMN